MFEIFENHYKKLINTPNFGLDKLEVCHYISSMLENNLNTFKSLKKYITYVNVFLDKWEKEDQIVLYMRNTDYNNRLYFYSCAMLELALFNCNELEKNNEILQGSKNAQVIRNLLSSTSEALSPNNYVDKNELQFIVYSVYKDMSSKKNSLQFSEVMNEYLKIYEQNFGNKLSLTDVYVELLNIKESAISKEFVQYEIKKLNNNIKSCGGIFKSAVHIVPSRIDEEVDKMGNAIPQQIMKDYIDITHETTEIANTLGIAEYSGLNEKFEMINQIEFSDVAMK